GFARRLPRRLGRHPQGSARLPPSPVQLRRDHAAPRRAFAKREGEGFVGWAKRPQDACQRVRRTNSQIKIRVGTRRGDAPLCPPYKNHKLNSQFCPTRSWPKLWCFSSATRRKPAA